MASRIIFFVLFSVSFTMLTRADNNPSNNTYFKNAYLGNRWKANPFGSISNGSDFCITEGYVRFLNTNYFDKNLSFGSVTDKPRDVCKAFPLKWFIINDIPKDVKLLANVVSIAEDGSKHHLVTVIFDLCDLSASNRIYLPDYLLELTADKNCIKKGDYKFNDFGPIKLDKMSPSNQMVNQTIEILHVMFSSTGIIKIVEYRAKLF